MRTKKSRLAAGFWMAKLREYLLLEGDNDRGPVGVATERERAGKLT